MKRARKYMVGLVITIVIISVSGTLMAPVSDTYVWWKQFYRLDKEELDTVFLGSSHCYCTFSPQIIDDITGKKSVQLGSGSMDMVGIYYYIQEVFCFQSPELVVIEAYSFIDRDMWVDEEKILVGRKHAIEAMNWGPVRIKANKEILGNKEAVKRLIPFLDYHVNWENPQFTEERLKYLIRPQLIDAKESYYTNDSKMTEDMANKYKTMDNIETKWEMDLDQREAFLKILEICEEKDAKLIVVMAPIYKEWRNHVDYEGRHNQIAALTESQGVLFLDYNNSDLYNKLSIDESCFFNDDSLDIGNTHLNKKGSELVSRHFAEWIKPQLIK